LTAEGTGPVCQEKEIKQMVEVDDSKCIACKQCVDICHEYCITLTDAKLSINQTSCSTCMQCIAICPRQALSWDNAAPIAFENGRLPSPENLDELFKQRRTVRRFTKNKIDRKVLEELAGYAMYAMSIGYPDVAFHNKIPNRGAQVQWNSSRS
jgi:ferredoxin